MVAGLLGDEGYGYYGGGGGVRDMEKRNHQLWQQSCIHLHTVPSVRTNGNAFREIADWPISGQKISFRQNRFTGCPREMMSVSFAVVMEDKLRRQKKIVTG